MSDETPIATKQLIAVWADGTRHEACVQIWRPATEGRSCRCRITATGLQPTYEPPPIGGSDEMQAITLSLGFVRFLLEWHIEHGGTLFYPPPDDDVPYTPDDLPPAIN
jgi:hypothetical protein